MLPQALISECSDRECSTDILILNMCEMTIFIVSVTSEIFYMGVKFGLSHYGYKEDHVLGQIFGQKEWK